MAEADGACAAAALEAYNVPLHVAAIFIIGGASLLGTLLPITTYWLKWLVVNDKVLIFGQFFGCGVVIATAFIHMIMPSINALNNPCLGSLGEDYEAFPLFVVMATVFIMQLIEFLISRRTSSNVTVSDDSEFAKQPKQQQQPEGGIVDCEDPAHHAPTDMCTQQHGHFDQFSATDAEVIDKERSRAFVSLILFEIGVGFHSVLIGVSLGVLSGSEFRALLTALVFHQFFEGWALGASIVQIEPTKATVLNTIIAYVLSTPVGIIVGILLRKSYNENSADALWTQGIFDAVSGGTLLYAGLVELLTYGLTINSKYNTKAARTSNVITAFTSLYLGAGAMALIGKWA